MSTCPFCDKSLYSFAWNDEQCYRPINHNYIRTSYHELFEIYIKNEQVVNTISLHLNYLPRDVNIRFYYFGNIIIITDLKIGEYLKENIIAFNFDNLKKMVALT